MRLWSFRTARTELGKDEHWLSVLHGSTSHLLKWLPLAALAKTSTRFFSYLGSQNEYKASHRTISGRTRSRPIFGPWASR